MAASYRAFISYSHRDEAFARWLHGRIEAWRVPRDLVGRDAAHGAVPQTLRPVFRDRDDFSGAHSLREATMRALEASQAMIVVCSPAAAASTYVNEEIRLFKTLGRSARVIPIIVSGTPGGTGDECFPEWLRREPDGEGRPAGDPVEPIAADARDVGDGRQRALAKVVAGLLGLPFDEIVRREERARRARIASFSGAGLGAFVFATAFSAYALYESYSASVAIERSVFSIGGLVQSAARLPERGEIGEVRRDMLREQCDLMDGLARGRAARPGLVEANLCFYERVVAEQSLLQEHGQAEPGYLLGTLCHWRERLWAARSPKPGFDETTALVHALARTLDAAERLPDHAGACPAAPFEGVEGHLAFTLERLGELGRQRPDHPMARGSHEDATWRLVELREQRQDWEGSARAMRVAAELRALQAGEVDSETVHPARVQLGVFQRRLAWLAINHLGDHAQAEADARAAVETWDMVVAAQPDHADSAYQQFLAREVLAEALLLLDRIEEALELLADTRDAGRRLIERLGEADAELRADVEEELVYVNELLAIFGPEGTAEDEASDESSRTPVPLDARLEAKPAVKPRRRRRASCGPQGCRR